MEDDNKLVEDFMSEQDDSDSISESSADVRLVPGAADIVVTVMMSPNLVVGLPGQPFWLL
ncbi:hypothetical protein J6590_006848 [Homalodisca vitripennis]|nr:hypothetical protein J6590_006848 [Homalodisca vitripennis]